jgi:hypothetical protein
MKNADKYLYDSMFPSFGEAAIANKIPIKDLRNLSEQLPEDSDLSDQIDIGCRYLNDCWLEILGMVLALPAMCFDSTPIVQIARTLFSRNPIRLNAQQKELAGAPGAQGVGPFFRAVYAIPSTC